MGFVFIDIQINTLKPNICGPSTGMTQYSLWVLCYRYFEYKINSYQSTPFNRQSFARLSTTYGFCF